MNQNAVKAALADCINHAQSDGVTLGRMLDQLGQAGFCFAALLLAMPFVQPLSLGPLTMIGGITFVALGWQMGNGRTSPALPQRVMNLNIHGKGWCRTLEFCQRILKFCQRFTKVRREKWVSGVWGERFVGWLIFSGGLLLAMPVASIPFNNSLPALMIVFACVGWLERDGLMVLVSLGWGIATVIYFAGLAVAFVFFGTTVFTWMTNFWPF